MEKSQSDGFYLILTNYVHSLFRDFENSLRIFTCLNENDTQLMSKQYNSNFTTYKVSAGAYTFKDLSEVLSRGVENEFEIRGRIRPNHENDESDSIIIDSDNVSLITTLRPGPKHNALKFDKKSFFNTVLGFTPNWDYKSFGNECYTETKQKFE